MNAVTTTLGQTEDVIVARVNGINITQQELDISLMSQVLPLKMQIYALRKAALENLILRNILEDEAKKRNISLAELRKLLTAGKIEVSLNQVEEAYAENASVFGAMSPDEAKERLRLDLENQARMQHYRETVLKLKEKADMQVFLEEPKLPFQNVAGSTASSGAEDAAITITEFSDFECPYCKQAHATLKEILRRYPKDVRIIFKHLPLEIHGQAFLAAQSAFCAAEQGFFWQYHDALFASDLLSPEAFDKVASDLALSMPKFKACLSSESSRIAILKDKREAEQFGINSTPTFIVNGKLVRGAIGFEEFKTIIDRELESSRKTSRTNEP